MEIKTFEAEGYRLKIMLGERFVRYKVQSLNGLGNVTMDEFDARINRNLSMKFYEVEKVEDKAKVFIEAKRRVNIYEHLRLLGFDIPVIMSIEEKYENKVLEERKDGGH